MSKRFRTWGWIDQDSLSRAESADVENPRVDPLSNLLFILPVLAGACIGIGTRLYAMVRRGDRTGQAFVFMAFTILYVAVLGNAVEYGENDRFRVETDPLLFVVALVSMKDAWTWAKRRYCRLHGERVAAAGSGVRFHAGLGDGKRTGSSACCGERNETHDSRDTD